MSDEIVANFVKAKLLPRELAPVDRHLDSCAECRMLVAALAGTLSEEENAASPVVAPQLGRYVLLEIVGQGAMGIVYEAYDPKLERKIAIKLLHPERESNERRLGPTRQERFLREAKAMARLVRSNVVTVHDTGVADDQVFVAMEYVEGLNLREWLLHQSRDTEAIVDAFMQAGAGLAAAHEAGIVHRDFKPDNVFVSKEGAVKEGDFGLVSLAEGEGSRDSEEVRFALGSGNAQTLGDLGGDADKATTLTQTGTRLGTALYMSPEQFDVTVFLLRRVLRGAIWGHSLRREHGSRDSKIYRGANAGTSDLRQRGSGRRRQFENFPRFPIAKTQRHSCRRRPGRRTQWRLKPCRGLRRR